MSSDWFVDTEASAYMTMDHSHLIQFENYMGKDCVVFGNGASLPIIHTGKIYHISNMHLLDLFVVPPQHYQKFTFN